MNISADLGDMEMLLETDLDLNNIDSVFSAIVSHGIYSKRGVLITVESNTLFLGAFSHFDTSVKETLLETGSCVSTRNKDFMVKMFQEKQKTLSILLLSESVIIFTNDLNVSLLQFIITRNLADGTLIKRSIDLDILMCLLAVNNFQDENEEDNTSIREQCFRVDYYPKNVQTTVDNESVSMHRSSRNDISNVSAIFPRILHSTTPIAEETVEFPNHSTDLEIIAFPNDTTDFEIIAFPNDSQKYNQASYSPSPEPKQSSNDERYPTQVTETDAGQLSLESYSRTKSSIYTERTGNRRSFVEQRENIQLNAEFSQEKPMQLNKSVVTSGTRIPYRAHHFRYPDYVEQQQRLASFQTQKWAKDKPDPFILAEWGFFFTAGSSQADSIRKNASPVPYKIRSPRYQTMEARLASFEKFPQRIQIPIQQLAVAGLFFTGNGDLCRCFTCDGGLKDWSTGDDPVKEHATYFPNCAYIKQLKGEGYVQQQQRRATTASGEQNGATSGNDTVTQPTQTVPNIPMERMTITNSDDSSYHVSQVVQMLGYAESEVKKAKAELERKGKLFPTTEEIVNTLLDMQEQTEHLQANALPQRSENDVQELVEENKKLSQLVYCMLCVTGEADILFLPCTHHRLCHECASDVDYCPVCNRFIKEKVKTFRS